MGRATEPYCCIQSITSIQARAEDATTQRLRSLALLAAPYDSIAANAAFCKALRPTQIPAVQRKLRSTTHRQLTAQQAADETS